MPNTQYVQLAEVILTDDTSPTDFDAEVDATAFTKPSRELHDVWDTESV